MYAIAQLLLGLAIAHALWAGAYVTGTLFERKGSSRTAGPDALFRLVALSLAGFALWGFQVFVFGLLGLFTPVGLACAALLDLAAFVILRREHPWRGEFWVSRWRFVEAAMRGPGLFVYAVALLLSVPAVIPDFSSDGVRVHLAYAYDWVRAGRIYAEQRMRFPYYAFNVELLDGLVMAIGAGRYVTFLSWLCGTLAALGVTGLLAFLDAAAQETRKGIQRQAAFMVYALAPLSLVLSAVFLRWWPTGMTDVIVSAFFLGIVGSYALAAASDDPMWPRILIVCGGFFAGMKPSYLFFIPFLVVALVGPLRKRGVGKRAIVGSVLFLLVLASPWYVRNLIYDGDPIPPVFNLALRGHDPNFTRAEWASIVKDLNTPRSLRGWIHYPIADFFDTQTRAFREYGVTVVVFVLYLIPLAAVMLAARLNKTPAERGRASVFGFTLVGMIYIMLSSALTRYTLLIYPELALCAAILIIDASRFVREGAIAAPIVTLAMAFPTPASHEFYHEFYGVYYAGLTQVLPNDETAYVRFVPAYGEARPLFNASILRNPRYDNVLLVDAPINYYVELHGAQPFGDYSGIGRYSTFVEAVDRGRAVRYLNANDIGALVIARSSGILVADELRYLHRQLEDGGFMREPSSDSRYVVYLRRVNR